MIMQMEDHQAVHAEETSRLSNKIAELERLCQEGAASVAMDGQHWQRAETYATLPQLTKAKVPPGRDMPSSLS